MQGRKTAVPFAGWVRYVQLMKSERKESSLREQKEGLEAANKKLEAMEGQLQTLRLQNEQVRRHATFWLRPTLPLPLPLAHIHALSLSLARACAYSSRVRWPSSRRT